MQIQLPEKYKHSIEFFINHMPGLILIKDIQSSILGMNVSTSKFLFDADDPISMIGSTDYDMKDDLRHLAKSFVDEDKVLQKKRKPIQILHGFIINNSPVFHLYNKTLMSDMGNDIAIMIHTYEILNQNIIHNFVNLGKQDNKRYGTKDNRLINYSLSNEYEDFGLSDRQAECLFYLLRGKSSGMIAKIRNISVRTVETYIEQLKNKMHCQTKAELIEKAINLGYINVVPKSVLNTIHPIK